MKLAIKNISKAFDRVQAVDDVTLDIPEGELFYLLGPSGCGKTTLLRVVAGFVKPDAGSVVIGENDVTTTSPRHRDTAMVFQNFALWPHMTVADNIGFGLAVRKVSRVDRKRRVEEALESVHLGGYGDRKPHQLSGGQQQRVAFARALVVSPGVLLLDEPLSGLDARLRVEMRAEIRRLCTERQQTTVCVTHDQKEALAVADRIAIMSEGIVVQNGTPREIYDHPRTSEIASFLGECNIVEATYRPDNDGQATLETPIGTLVASDTLAENEGTPLLLSIRPENIHLQPIDGFSGNKLEGKVVEQTYQGDSVHYHVAIGEQILKITALPGVLPGDGKAGTTIACYVDPTKINMMKE
ncbi:MAG: ABC transporter ATP-binding protein [Planctomycetota bacterium]|jgi:iron(III) transport system ATP-binding protein